MSWTSDHESALAFHNSIFDPCRAAIILICNSFSLTSPFNDGSPPTLSHSNSLLCHLPLRSAKPSARREDQHHPFLAHPHSSTSSSVMISSSSPHHLFFFFPPLTPTPTLVSYTPSHRPLSKVLHYSRTCSRRPVLGLPSPWTKKISTRTYRARIGRQTPQFMRNVNKEARQC